jgi:hypothetical protein
VSLHDALVWTYFKIRWFRNTGNLQIRGEILISSNLFWCASLQAFGDFGPSIKDSLRMPMLMMIIFQASCIALCWRIGRA